MDLSKAVDVFAAIKTTRTKTSPHTHRLYANDMFSCFDAGFVQ